MSQDQPKATFVTFYSFKGGVGRSMALINTAGILAGRGFRVLVMDLDLEAPGLSYLDPDAPDASPSEQKPRTRPLQLGFVDLLIDAKKRGQEADLFALSVGELASRYTQAYHVPDDLLEFKDGSLHIMPAGRFDGSYAQRFDDLNLHVLYEEGLGEPLIRAFKKKFAEAGRYDYVLVDSRTGFSDEAGICTRDLADHLMILSGLNRQNVEGTCEFLKSLRVATDGKKSFQIILSPVPNGEDALLDQREKAAKAAFEEAWGSEVDLSLQIPYHPQLALTEEPHIFRRRRGYLFDAYLAIERRMLSVLGHDARTLMRKIEERLQQEDYPAVLRDLRHLIRLDSGKTALSHFAGNLGTADNRPSLPSKADGELSQEKATLDKILRDDDGRRVVEFVVDHVLGGESEWGTGALLKRLIGTSPDLADRLYKRLADAGPSDADTLGNYAVFLLNERGDKDSAEAYFKRAIEADPKSAHHLGNYAIFLKSERGDMDSAEAYYKRAIVEADPKHANNLGNYAVFLESERGDMDSAEAYYKRAIEADPKHANILSNYGQLLAGLARFSEGEKALLAAVEHLDGFSAANMAESCFSLWLVSRMQEHDAKRWERGFKFLVQQGFKRHPWSFDRMLEQAEKVLPPEELEYAKALALAFLDENKVADLERYERWRALEPLDPKGTGQPI